MTEVISLIPNRPGTVNFFQYAIRRYRIKLARDAGKPMFPGKRPGIAYWTDDPVLQQYRFCNVFREDDRVTIWFREHVRDPLASHPDVLFATVAFRFFNTIKTGQRMLAAGLLTNWNAQRAREQLSDLRPLITGAYMVKTPLGKPKLEGLIEIMEPVWRDRLDLAEQIYSGVTTLEAAHALFMQYPWVGPFMAYEIVTDLRHTYLLNRATDINFWANPGPGAMRGLNRVVHGTVEKSVSKDEMQTVMRELLMLAEPGMLWPGDWPRWEMREVEHTLCEFDKYMRAVKGEGTPKQLYHMP